MSTYSLAFVVSKFTCFGLLNADLILHQVCSRPGQESDHQTAANFSNKLTTVFEVITGSPFSNFSLNKIDHAAIPDLPMESTENWGLALYR